MTDGSNMDVSLDISSDTSTLAELEQMLGVRGDSGSRTRGDHLPSGRTSTRTILRIFSNLKNASLSQHVQAILTRVAAEKVRALHDCTVTLTIATYFAGAYAQLVIDVEVLEMARAYGARIEVVAYPSSD